MYLKNQWYAVDVTWDDDEVNYNNNYNFFLINFLDFLQLVVAKSTKNIKKYIFE